MVKNWRKFLESTEELVNVDYVNGKMDELKDIIMDNGEDFQFEWSIDEKSGSGVESQGQLNITLTSSIITKFEFDLDSLKLEKLIDDEVEFSEVVDSIDEGLDIIEKEIYHYIGVSENKMNESTQWLPPSMLRELNQLSQRNDDIGKLARIVNKLRDQDSNTTYTKDDIR